MARSEAWLKAVGEEFLTFQTRMHNKGLSIMEIASVFTRLDEDEDMDSDEDFVALVMEDLR